MITKPVLSEIWLVVGFVVIALWSLASSLYSQRSLISVQQQAETLLTNALPSIEHLSAARTALRHLDNAYSEYLPTAGPQARADLEVALRELDREKDAYLRLPSFPGERDLAGAADSQIDQMTQLLLHAVSERAASPVASRGRADPVHVAADLVDERLHQLVQFNTQHAAQSVLRSEQARRHSEQIPLLIDILGVLLAGVLAILAVRAIRRYMSFHAEHDRLLALRADELEQFAGRVAHDIRNPLNVVSMVLGLLKPGLAPDSKAAERLERARSAMSRVRCIIDGLYEFARAGARPRVGSRADVVAVLSDSLSDVRPLAEEAGIELRIEPLAGDGPPVQVACDPGMLTSVMTNLLRNAIKYMNDCPVRTVTARVARLPGWVRVEIEDTGPGIPSELHASIFEPYVRAASSVQQGIGLGLATVKRIVESHAGRIGVRSAPGHGSRFWFELPDADSPTAR